jgi:hypothetical protein
MESKRFSCHICNRNSCEMAISNYYSQEVSAFHDSTLPEPGLLVGYALLITELEKTANVPLPDQLAIVTEKHQRYDTEQWKVFTARHRPSEDLMSHLSFALKHEGIDLYILKSSSRILAQHLFRQWSRKWYTLKQQANMLGGFGFCTSG